MSNKLRNIFSDDKVSLGGKFNFKDKEAYVKFVETLGDIEQVGGTHDVEGIESIEIEIRCGERIYPVDEFHNVTDMIVTPAEDIVPLELDTEIGKKKLIFFRQRVKELIVLETMPNSIVSFKVAIKGHKVSITYHANPEKANSIEAVVESYCIAAAFLEKFFKEDYLNQSDENDANLNIIIDAKAFFMRSCTLFKKLSYIEKQFDLKFNLKKLSDDKQSQINVEELYYLLNKKKAIRINTKNAEVNAIDMKMVSDEEHLKEGSILDFTFTSHIEFSLWEHNVVIHTANLLTNAIIKKIETCELGETKIVYGSEDSRPMFVSYKGFLKAEDAMKELEELMGHKMEYIEAHTLGEAIMEDYK